MSKMTWWQLITKNADEMQRLEEGMLSDQTHPTEREDKILIDWPESQRIMEHPEAELDLDSDSAYWVPEKVWEEYKDKYYEE